MQVVLSTIGKFHSFHLARELLRRQMLAKIYTGYPWTKLKGEAIPRARVSCFPWIHAPYLKFFPKGLRLRRAWERTDKAWFDRYCSLRLPECDAFIGLSGSASKTGQAAKSRGAIYICDRGSSHIRYQDRILSQEFELNGAAFVGVDPRVIEAEEREYQLADAIFVPSGFVKQTFISAGIPECKLKLIPYGVNLARFRRTSQPSAAEFNVLFVGAISLRKGLQYLLPAFNRLEHPKKRLTIVGGESGEPIPQLNEFRKRCDVTFAGHIPNTQLPNLMSSSHVLVLPSVEEGLAMVQAEALACGCPVIATRHTGSEDLYSDGQEGFIVPIRSAEALTEKLQRLADDPQLRAEMSRTAIARAATIRGWDGYGEAVVHSLQSVLQRTVFSAVD